MPRANDLTGQTFGRLTALSYTGKSDKKGRIWLCSCVCGTSIEVRGSHLKDGTKQSCGCLYQERIHDLSGKRFGKLHVVNWSGRSEKGGRVWVCNCDCGNTLEVVANSLVSGRTTSCGCVYKESRQFVSRTHGMSNSREYKIWYGIIQRCCNPNNDSFKYYGARGIRVCERWRNSFEAFYVDMGPSNGLTIDRINNDGNYEPGNCRWANTTVQSFNARLSSRNKTGIRGVSLDVRSGKYMAKMTIKGETVLNKLFDTIEEAEEARINAENKYSHLILKN